MSEAGDALPADVQAAIEAGRKIEAIKLLRRHRGMDLKAAKDLVESRSPLDAGGPGGQAITPDTGFWKLIFAVAALALIGGAWELISELA